MMVAAISTLLPAARAARTDPTIGCGFGLALSAGSVRLLSGMLYGVSSFDAVTFCGVVALVLASSVPSSHPDSPTDEYA
jgi:hypothetical protein